MFDISANETIVKQRQNLFQSFGKSVHENLFQMGLFQSPQVLAAWTFSKAIKGLCYQCIQPQRPQNLWRLPLLASSCGGCSLASMQLLECLFQIASAPNPSHQAAFPEGHTSPGRAHPQTCACSSPYILMDSGLPPPAVHIWQQVAINLSTASWWLSGTWSSFSKGLRQSTTTTGKALVSMWLPSALAPHCLGPFPKLALLSCPALAPPPIPPP